MSLDPKAMRLAGWIFTATLVVLHTSAAAAAPAEEADALITKGNALRRAGDDLGSIPLLQQAYKINPGPRTAVHLGMAEYALGRWADADQHLTEALKSPEDPWIKKNMVQIVDSLRLAKTHVSRVEITGDPAGAEVLVNGRVVGQLPLPQPIAVNAGSADIELRAPGYQAGFRTVNVTGGQYQSVVIRLAREGPRTGSTPLTSAGAPGGPAAGDLQSDPSDLDTPGPRWRPITIGVALGAAGLGLGLGGYGWWYSNRKATAFNKHPCFDKSGSLVRSDGSPDPTCRQLNTTHKNARTLSIAGFTAAGALATTALLVWLLTPATESTAHTPTPPSIACLPTPSQALSCTFAF